MNKPSNRIIVFLVLTATLAVAALGFSLMSEPGHLMMGCFGTMPGGSCSALGPVEHFEAHFNTFENISTGIAKAFTVLAALLIAVALFLDLKERRTGPGTREFAFARRDAASLPPQAPLIRWLALHEKRDPSLVYAMNA